MDPRTSLGWVWPEVVVVATILAVILADIVRLRALACGLTIAGFAAAAGLIFNQGDAGAIVFDKAYAVDGFASAFKLLFLGAGLLTALFSGPAIRG